MADTTVNLVSVTKPPVTRSTAISYDLFGEQGRRLRVLPLYKQHRLTQISLTLGSDRSTVKCIWLEAVKVS